jgi:hypothetical protein
MPAPLPLAGVTHFAVTAPAVDTPTTQPWYGVRSQWPPKAAYTTPSISRRPGRCSSFFALKLTLGALSAVPEICTGKPGRSAPVLTSTA